MAKEEERRKAARGLILSTLIGKEAEPNGRIATA